MSVDKAAETIENNENESVRAQNNVRKDPPGRAPGTLDAKWGDEPAKDRDGDQVAYSSAVKREAHDGREGVVDRLFDSVASSAKADQDAIGDYFNAKTVSEARTPHSLLLRHGKDKTAAAESLTDQVVRICGRR